MIDIPTNVFAERIMHDMMCSLREFTVADLLCYTEDAIDTGLIMAAWIARGYAVSIGERSMAGGRYTCEMYEFTPLARQEIGYRDSHST